MDTSLFFAKFFGIYYVVMAVVWLLRGPAVARSMSAWTGNPASMMLAGIMTLLIGAAMVASHQVYELSWRGLITLFGYVALAKGVVLIGWPEGLGKDYSRWARGPMRWITGLICLAIGGWFAWIGFGA